MNEIILALKSLMETALTGMGITFRYGEAKATPSNELPLIEIVPISSSMKPVGTGGSFENEFRIRINVKRDLKDSITADTNKTVLDHFQALVKLVEERDADKQPKAATVFGVLRSNIKLSNTVHLETEFVAEYDQLVQSGSWIAIARINITAIERTPN